MKKKRFCLLLGIFYLSTTLFGQTDEIQKLKITFENETNIEKKIAEMDREGVNRLIAIRRIQSRQALKARAQACRRGMTSCH